MEDDDKYEADDPNDRGDPRFCIRRRRVKLCQEGDGNAPVLTVKTVGIVQSSWPNIMLHTAPVLTVKSAFYSLPDPA